MDCSDRITGDLLVNKSRVKIVTSDRARNKRYFTTVGFSNAPRVMGHDPAYMQRGRHVRPGGQGRYLEQKVPDARLVTAEAKIKNDRGARHAARLPKTKVYLPCVFCNSIFSQWIRSAQKYFSTLPPRGCDIFRAQFPVTRFFFRIRIQNGIDQPFGRRKQTREARIQVIFNFKIDRLRFFANN